MITLYPGHEGRSIHLGDSEMNVMACLSSPDPLSHTNSSRSTTSAQMRYAEVAEDKKAPYDPGAAAQPGRTALLIYLLGRSAREASNTLRYVAEMSAIVCCQETSRCTGTQVLRASPTLPDRDRQTDFPNPLVHLQKAPLYPHEVRSFMLPSLNWSSDEGPRSLVETSGCHELPSGRFLMLDAVVARTRPLVHGQHMALFANAEGRLM